MTLSNAERMLQAMHKLKKTNAVSGIIGGTGMSQGEFMMLQLIKYETNNADEVTISELSERLKVSKSAVSQMINALEDKGFVERITTKNDRRMVYVKLTEIGAEHLAKAVSAFVRVINDILEKMGKEDTETLLGLLNKLYLIADEHNLNT